MLVRGFFSSDTFLIHLDKAIRDSGVAHIAYPEFTSRLGADGIDKMGEQIAEAVEKLKKESKHDRVDIVAYSMGALAARYYLQKLGGKTHVRKFVSLSGAHYGTYLSYFGYFNKGIRDMAPHSALIDDLDRDANPFGDVQIYSYYTPYDLIIIPTSSSILKESFEVKRFSAIHQTMVSNPEVLAEVVEALKTPAKVLSASNP